MPVGGDYLSGFASSKHCHAIAMQASKIFEEVNFA
jgi:hypothetical protein